MPSHQLGEEGGGGGGEDADTDEVAGAMSGGGEDGNFVLGGSAEELVGVAFGCAFYQYFEFFADVLAVAFKGELVLQGDHAVEAFDFYVFGDVVGHFAAGECAGSFGVFEHECGVKTCFAHER